MSKVCKNGSALELFGARYEFLCIALEYLMDALGGEVIKQNCTRIIRRVNRHKKEETYTLVLNEQETALVQDALLAIRAGFVDTGKALDAALSHVYVVMLEEVQKSIGKEV